MNLSQLSVRKPVLAWMLMLGFMVFGYLGFRKLGVSQLPDIDFPTINVGLALPGAAPEVMELEVVDPIEDVLSQIEGVESISSSSRSGSANVSVEFELGRDMNQLVQEIQSKISQIQRQLPVDLEPPSVSKSNPNDHPIMWLGVSSDKKSVPELMQYVRESLKDRFSTVSGVSDVYLGGFAEPSLRVWVSQKKLAERDLTVLDVASALQEGHAEFPSGRIEEKDREFNIRTMGEAKSLNDFQNIALLRRGGAPNFNPARLSDVARVELGTEDIRRRSRVMGKPAVGIGIVKQRDANAVQVGELVKKRMEEVLLEVPEDIKIGLNFDSTKFIKESVHELNFTLILSAILTSLVCWAFLGSWTSTLNVILAIPTSILGCFMFMQWMGFTLNTFSLLALTLAIGIVVDDAIMILENIVRHREMGKSRVKAALEGTGEIQFAAMAATVAIIAIFLPVAFMKGITGAFFFQFGVVLSIAVALSLLEALTLTPMRCAQWVEAGGQGGKLENFVSDGMGKLVNAYSKALSRILRIRWVIILGSLVFFAASLVLFKKLKAEFTPSQDQSILMVRMTAPQGSSLDFTDRKTLQVEDYLQKRSEVERYFSSVGGFGGGEVSSSIIFVTLKPKDQRKLSQDELAESFREDLKSIPDVKVSIQDPSRGGFGSRRGYPVELTIEGPEWDGLIDVSSKLVEKMKTTEGLRDVDSDFQGKTQEVHIIPNARVAAMRGVSMEDVARVVSSLMGGMRVGRYTHLGHRYYIWLRVADVERNNVEALRSIQIRNNRGELIPLGDVAQIKMEQALQTVSRLDRRRTIGVYANLSPNASQADVIKKVEATAKSLLPAGYSVVKSGSAKRLNEGFQSLAMALFMGILISYMVLASQFNSFLHPITILIPLPFSISGALIALWLGGQSLNIFSLIGFLLLMGIVKKNSILLVDFTNQMREQGLGVREALISACPKRLRPILMTSLATVVGALPAAMAIGPGAETRIPMALVVIGGVLLSTVLTLFIVPCVYYVLTPERRVKAMPVEQTESLQLRQESLT